LKIINFTFLKGINNQGSNGVHQGNQLGCHKGHLYSAMTASGDPANAANSAHSTYQYTNAVPQCGAFNTGQWRIWEGNIRAFAVQTCIPAGGILYLVTRISFVAIQPTPPAQPDQPAPLPQPIAVPIVQFAPGIDKLNSMWTVGACLYSNNQCGTFAVIGNNVPNPTGMLTQEITVAHLDGILQFDIQTNGLKRDRSSRRARLFSGVSRCSNVQLPKAEYPTENKKPSKSGKSGHKSSSSSSTQKPSGWGSTPSSKQSSKSSLKSSTKSSSKSSLKSSSKSSSKPSSKKLLQLENNTIPEATNLKKSELKTQELKVKLKDAKLKKQMLELKIRINMEAVENRHTVDLTN